MNTKSFYLESYGCSMNAADSERLAGFLESNSWRQVSSPSKAAFLLLNTCAVKVQTERKMLQRVRLLDGVSMKSGSKLLVCGCLPKVNPAAIKGVSSKVLLAGTSLSEVASALGLRAPNPFSVEGKPFNRFVSIIQLAEGCVGNCSYCCVKSARGKLRSNPLHYLLERFKRAARPGCEVWLTAQDTGCYGFDIGLSLPFLLKRLLASTKEKRFRVRVGMMNPQHLALFYDEYVSLFEDERLYMFFHIPVQSGSDRVLRAMNRGYSSAEAKRLCRRLRRDLPLASIATDVIVGFPGETERDFDKTIELLEEIQPDVLNISRFGARPNTSAALMPCQLHGRVKKERSRRLTILHKEIALERNRLFLGLEQRVLVIERGSTAGFVGRNPSYKPVVIERGSRGRFASVSIEEASPTYLRGRLLKQHCHT